MTLELMASDQSCKPSPIVNHNRRLADDRHANLQFCRVCPECVDDHGDKHMHSISANVPGDKNGLAFLPTKGGERR